LTYILYCTIFSVYFKYFCIIYYNLIKIFFDSLRHNSNTFWNRSYSIEKSFFRRYFTMSDLQASNCGCNQPTNCDNGCGFGGFGNWIWILLLLCCCGNGNGNGGCGISNFGGGCGCGESNGCGSWIWILLLLCCCGNGNGGCGCGNNNGCGCC